LGKCKEGELNGVELDVIPSVMTTWQDWLTKYPKTTVMNLSRTSFAFNREAYRFPEKYVFGVKVQDQPKAYGFAYLIKNQLIEDSINGEPVLVVFDPESTHSFIYSRKMEESILTFESKLVNEFLVDKETGSLWDPWNGKAVEGPHKGKRLNREYGIVSFLRAWRTFYQDSLIELGDRNITPK